MNRFELIAPCHFGMEAVLKREIYDLGYDIEQVEDGKVTFIGDEEAICRANVFLRTTERILLKVGKFKATTFDELFENIKKIEWENYLPKDAKSACKDFILFSLRSSAYLSVNLIKYSVVASILGIVLLAIDNDLPEAFSINSMILG